MGKYDKKNVNSGGRTSAPRDTRAPGEQTAQLGNNPEMETIARWLASVKFQKKALGGLDPVDVWKKIEELNGLYENALLAERVRYNMLLRQLRMTQSPADVPEGENG